MGGAGIIIWILVFFGIFYFLAIRPQRRQRQAHQEMVSMLKKGDEVVTIGGMFGTITRIGDDWVELEIAKRTRVRYLKRAISSITSIDEGEEEDEYIEAGEDDFTDESDEAEDEAAELEAGDTGETADEAEDAEEPADEAPEAPEAPKA
jgi:preprotein translocase subunit YajC